MSAPLSDDARTLATAIREVLRVPRPLNGADQREFLQLQRTRVVCVDSILRHLLAEEDLDVEAAARLIREVADSEPVTYRTDEPGTTCETGEICGIPHGVGRRHPIDAAPSTNHPALRDQGPRSASRRRTGQ
ncbi:hypothetical protein [Actinomadura sp. 21ATH]|uniref:hypothetical protein n=1 Tax=Actinomadura sp. 21ATH TaxID=1735444 RepID=UPI0035BFF390